MLRIHSHEWTQVGARLVPNGRWQSVWSCALCPDVGAGGYTGPDPDGLCQWCGWVQHTLPATECEECGGELDAKSTTPLGPKPHLGGWFIEQITNIWRLEQ